MSSHGIARLFQVGCVDLVHEEVNGAAGVVVADTGGRASLLPQCRSCNSRIAPGALVRGWEGGGRTIKHAVCPGRPVYIHRACDGEWPDDC